MLITNFDELTKLDEAIHRILVDMQGSSPGSDEYAKMADQLTKLIKTKEIIGNLKLKQYEAVNKKDNDAFNNRHKDEELVLRRTELAARESDSAKTAELRGRELDLRSHESVVSQTLKAQEMELRQEELDDRRRISKETLAVIGANLAGIVLILSYEKANVIASKALGFISKLR